MKTELSYTELYNARRHAKDRLQECKQNNRSIFKKMTTLALSGQKCEKLFEELNKNEDEIEMLENRLCEIDEKFYKVSANIEFQNQLEP